ncbi:5-methylcytosine restriction system specificity protein McrC [Clostridioides difficile]
MSNRPKDKKIYNLSENESFSLRNSSKELSYIKQRFKTCFEFTKGKNETIVKGKNIVGVLDLGDSIYRIYPKVGDVLNIFNMINRVSTSDYENINGRGYLYLDPKVLVNVEEGNTKLIEALILTFLNELCKISKIGYTKNYNKNIENIYFLRGKLDVSKQVRKNILGTKFYCKFNELIFYTPENIILYKAIDKLLTRYKLGKDIRSKLLFYKNELSVLINPVVINNIDINRTFYCKNRTNSHYETLIAISQIILKDRFASSLRHGNGLFCNFMIKTDLLFEQYIFILLNELINEKYKNYYLRYQHTIDSIVKVDNNFNKLKNNSFLKMDADFLILEKDTERPILVVDTKYVDIYEKNKLGNYAYYQMISYLTGLNIGVHRNKGISSILLAHGDEGNTYKVANEECDMYIMTKGIDILENEISVKNRLDAIIGLFLSNERIINK